MNGLKAGGAEVAVGDSDLAEKKSSVVGVPLSRAGRSRRSSASLPRGQQRRLFRNKTLTETNTLPVTLKWRPGFLASSHTFDITHRKSKSASLFFFAPFTVEREGLIRVVGVVGASTLNRRPFSGHDS